jgi:secreted trypsin-like serine protease
MFRTALLLVCALLTAEARPRTDLLLHTSVDVDLAVIGGTNASPGAWPWQLSQQRFGTAWSHSCGASLLSSNKALSAAHCVDGAAPNILRVVAGQHDRTDYTGTQISDVAGFTMHEQYNNGAASFANDIAILDLQAAISTGGNVALATLPPNNNDQFVGAGCTITGWGRTSSSNTLPNILQQAPLSPISTSECQSRVGSIGTIWANHICVYDSSNQRGACNGDSGGPLNCPNGGDFYVAGVTSFVIQSGGACQVSYPSVYTRTSTYLGWIAANTQ